MKKKLSIIVPVYNQIKYIDCCLQSVLQQINEEVEVLLIDDGSFDGSEAVCEKYGGICKNIKVIHKKNGGLSSARNEGIWCAKGEYFLFLDSDDELSMGAIDCLLSRIKKFSPDIIFFGYTYKKKTGYKLHGSNDVKRISGEESVKLLVTNQIGNHICFNAYKRELFEGIDFPIGRNYEDIATFYKLLLKSEKNIMIDSSMYIYNLTNKSAITQTFNAKNLSDMYQSINEFEAGLKEKCVELGIDEYLEYYKRNIYAYIFLKSKSCKGELQELRYNIFDYLWDHKKYNLKMCKFYSRKRILFFYLITFMCRKGTKN